MSLEKTIEKIFQTHAIRTPYQFENATSAYQSFAAYNQDKELIIFRSDSLSKEWDRVQELGFQFELTDFIEVIIFHELGHANDQKIGYYQEEKKKALRQLTSVKNKKDLEQVIERLGNVIIESEMNAWSFVEKHLPLSHPYTRYKKDCLTNYIQYLEKMYVLALKKMA